MALEGLVDVQVNGYLGVDCSSPKLELEDIIRVTETLRGAGTAAYCPTIITTDLGTYKRNLPILAAAMEAPGARESLLGIHMEGPYLSTAEGARGAHAPEPAFLTSIRSEAVRTALRCFDPSHDWERKRRI